jgi:hypothetical protein
MPPIAAVLPMLRRAIIIGMIKEKITELRGILYVRKLYREVS